MREAGCAVVEADRALVAARLFVQDALRAAWHVMSGNSANAEVAAYPAMFAILAATAFDLTKPDVPY